MIGHKPKMTRSKTVNFDVPKITKEKTEKKEGKREVGRPTTITADVIAKLESAFAIGATDIEACAFAEVSTDALYRYEKQNPDFRIRKEQLKQKPVLIAKNTVAEYAKKDPRTAQWLLEKKCKEEYGQVVKVEADASITASLSLERIKEIKKMLDTK